MVAMVDASRREEEVFVPLPAPKHQLPPTTQFRSTWIVSSQNTLRERGHYDRYVELLPPELRETITMTIVGAWLPIEHAVAHYTACDRLELSAADRVELGRAVTKHLDQTLLSTAARLATSAGATVWTPLGQIRRLWERMFVGGGMAVYKLGPKETRIEVHGCALAPIAYFRTGLQGVLQGIGERFCQKLYVSEIPRMTTPTSIAYRGSWV